MTTENSQVQRNLDVYTSEEQIASHEDHFFMQEHKFLVLKELLSSISTRSVVADVGCLTGVGSVRHKKIDGVDEVHVFDASSELLELAELKGLKPHQWTCGEEVAPISDNYFDVVIASDIIEHIVNTDYFLSELIRIAKPGGSIILTMPNLGWWLNRWRLMFGKIPVSFPGVSSTYCADSNIDLNHIRINIASEWSGFFKHHGLEIEDLRGYRLIMGMKWYLRFWNKIVMNPKKMFGLCYKLKVPTS